MYWPQSKSYYYNDVDDDNDADDTDRDADRRDAMPRAQVLVAHVRVPRYGVVKTEYRTVGTRYVRPRGPEIGPLITMHDQIFTKKGDAKTARRQWIQRDRAARIALRGRRGGRRSWWRAEYEAKPGMFETQHHICNCQHVVNERTTALVL